MVYAGVGDMGEVKEGVCSSKVSTTIARVAKYWLVVWLLMKERDYCNGGWLILSKYHNSTYHNSNNFSTMFVNVAFSKYAHINGNALRLWGYLLFVPLRKHIYDMRCGETMTECRTQNWHQDQGY